ncbi:hypothetical protein [Pseudomonas sp. DWP3-1-2]|uniref:hypothetical protein n=1 Tax=Pseudomonas sp. DWP3-1-2 TaxID=2804645 RepID=UPI003CEDC32D
MNTMLLKSDPTEFNSFSGFIASRSNVNLPSLESPSATSELASNALNLCLNIVSKTAAPEPHFLWSDLESVTICPSDYQFKPWWEGSSDLVCIEDEDIVLRAYCSDAERALEAYTSLSQGWDGDNAPPPKASSLDDATVFLRLLSANVESCPNILPGLDHEGIPMYIFDTDDIYISLSFYGDLSATFFMKNRATKDIEAYEFDMEEPRQLARSLELIRSL